MGTTIIQGAVIQAPAKVIVEMSLHEALVYACLEGGSVSSDSITGAGLFRALYAHPRYAVYKAARDAGCPRCGPTDFSGLRAETERLYG